MNPFNHFLVSFNVLLILFHKFATIGEIILFSLIFGALLDLDEIFGTLLKRPEYHLRTLVQEPFGFILIGIPFGILFAFMLKPYYFFLIIIPYALHIILDYMTFHEAKPLLPFSKKTVRTGFIRPIPPTSCYKIKFEGEKGVPESYVLILNLIVAVTLLLIYF